MSSFHLPPKVQHSATMKIPDLIQSAREELRNEKTHRAAAEAGVFHVSDTTAHNKVSEGKKPTTRKMKNSDLNIFPEYSNDYSDKIRGKF